MKKPELDFWDARIAAGIGPAAKDVPVKSATSNPCVHKWLFLWLNRVKT